MRISYEDFSQQQTNSNNNNNTFHNYLKYFSLKNDGDEAIVRFMTDSPDQFDILDVHNVKNGQWEFMYNCIRDYRDPIDRCPLCAAGMPMRRRFFIKLIQYTNEGGRILSEAKIWQRSTNYVNIIKSIMDEYSPLSDYLFKIKRIGKAGDTNTTYNIIPCNPSVYSQEVYRKDLSLFDGYNVLGSTVQDKDYNELNKLVSKTNGAETRGDAFNTPTPQESTAQPKKEEIYPKTSTSTYEQPVQSQRRYTETTQESNQFTPIRRY